MEIIRSRIKEKKERISEKNKPSGTTCIKGSTRRLKTDQHKHKNQAETINPIVAKTHTKGNKKY
jgi:hypothetical protein